MRQTTDPINMFTSQKLSAVFTAAVTDICTLSAHGFSTGDKVRVSTDNTLPAGLAANTDYYVVVISSSTFYLNSKPGDSSADRVNITSTGTGNHTVTVKSRVIDTEDFKNAMLSVSTSGSANFTFKVQASAQEDVNFENAASSTNRWDYVQIIDLEDGATIDGDTGVSFSGSDDNRQFEVNLNFAKWVCIDITSWTAGTMNATLTLARD